MEETQENKISGEGESGLSVKSILARIRSNPDKVKKTPKKSISKTEEKGEEINRQLDKLYSPKAFKKLVQFPCDIMALKSGHDHWEMLDEEAELLAESASECAKIYINLDPKYAFLILFLSQATFSYGSRIMKEVNLSKKEKLDGKPKT